MAGAAQSVVAVANLGTDFDIGVRTPGKILLARPGLTLVSDANYQALPTDIAVVVTALTAARTITMPLVAGLAYPGQIIRIIDASGACSPGTPINVVPYSASGSDAIGGGSISLSSPYQWVDLIAPVAGLWVYR